MGLHFRPVAGPRVYPPAGPEIVHVARPFISTWKKTKATLVCLSLGVSEPNICTGNLLDAARRTGNRKANVQIQVAKILIGSSHNIFSIEIGIHPPIND